MCKAAFTYTAKFQRLLFNIRMLLPALKNVELKHCSLNFFMFICLSLQGLMLMLQNLPTQNWSDSEIGVLVAEAYRLKFTFADAPNHLQSGER